MSESCLVINPAAARNEGMRRRTSNTMGITSRDSAPVGNILGASVGNNSATGSNSNSSNHYQHPGAKLQQGQQRSSTSPRQVTDSDTETKGSDPSSNSNTQQAMMVENGHDGSGSSGLGGGATELNKRKAGTVFLQRSGPSMDNEHESSEQGTSGPCSENNPSLPLHEQIQPVDPLDISYCCTPASLKLRSVLISRLSIAAPSGKIQVIDLSRRGLTGDDGELIANALRNNPQLAVLKLGYNDLGDKGATLIGASCSKDGRHHLGLTVLDLGFNNIGDDGCTELSLHMLAGNHRLRNFYLSGNNIKRKGAMALAGAILHGCSLARLHLSANKLGSEGVKVLAGAVAEMDARRQHLLQRQGGIVVAAVKPIAIEELYLGDIAVRSQGIANISSMLVSNQSLRLLNLSNNEIDDRDMALLSQALAQNKQIPLCAIHLSFNKITCVGVECFMNAIWGSQTLKEVKLDNNKMQDRGAQLCSVVLGSVRLENLDISFNRVSTVGIKAVMKSLSENDSLRTLSLSGIPMDQNASKAVSYALAYNQSLEKFHIDSCCVGYSGQRHIVAGIVSNRNVKLRSVTGFPLGPITKTLGLPQVPEDWGNDRVLSFVRFMWSYCRLQNAGIQAGGPRGPAPPSLVAASAKKAFSSLSESEASKMAFQQEHATQAEESPIVSPDASILVRSQSGRNLQIPAWDDQIGAEDEDHSWSSETDSLDRSSYTGSSGSSAHNVTEVNPERRNKNLQWLRAHFQSLSEVGSLVFNNADLWQLHQYFFSPAYNNSDESESDTSGQDESSKNGSCSKDDEDEEEKLSNPANAPPSTPIVSGAGKGSSLGRPISFKTLGDAVKAAAADIDARRPNKRGSLDEALRDAEPCAKRAKNLKPRIAYYPRIREKLESLGTKPSAQTLSLLRQLKYIESVMLQGKNVYSDEQEYHGDQGPDASDVEMILLDLL